jgi:RHS repeat-associated protein
VKDEPKAPQRAPVVSSPAREAPAQASEGADKGARMGGIAPVSSAAPSLPKGGGAIRGIGEKFAMNPVTGTASFTVPIATSPGRGGFGPELSLAYDSGSGNGPFGLGWHLSIPSITRKTDKGLPQYDDANESDAFILSGAEDLVPTLVEGEEGWERETAHTETHWVDRYRPRVEGLFARVERHRSKTTLETFWKATTRDNVTSVYGESSTARIADPEHPERVFSWLLERTEEPKGNIVAYEYKPEDLVGVSSATPSEHHRHKGWAPITNRYLKHIRYGNATPYVASGWLFEVVFDYGEHDAEAPEPDEGDPEGNPWSVRQDAFSSYKATFEMRTYRLCRRVLMFHRMDELAEEAAPVLVRSTDFTYVEDAVLTKLVSVTHAGYVKDEGSGDYTKKTYPPVGMVYTDATLAPAYGRIEAADVAARQLAGGSRHWVDLDGEGVPGLLTETLGGWSYRRNQGDGEFGAARTLRAVPGPARAGGALESGYSLSDVDGNGRLELVTNAKPGAGYYERTDRGWSAFRAFRSVPNIDWSDPSLRMLDLDGDGHADVLIVEDHVLRWYPSLGANGFGPARQAPVSNDEERGPRPVFREEKQTFFVADMTGDGLLDLVRIRQGDIAYWPNLGFGRFGAKVVMDAPPKLDRPNLFDPRRIRLADVDGSGTTDILYLRTEGLFLWRNLAGNGWSAPEKLDFLPTVDGWAGMSVMDLLGTGTACLAGGSPAYSKPLRYVELYHDKKPHLLTSMVNNLGLETRIEYTPSTRYYLDDVAAGTPWATRLPFPVQCVSRVETYDAIRKARFVSLYRYRHGFFDGVEREFRGFALVEQWDTESFSVAQGVGLFPDVDPENEDPETHLPPVHTKTWFHTGAFLEGARVAAQLASEYFQGDTLATLLPDTTLPAGLSADEQREACRALRGQVLRQEVYTEDGSLLEAAPYTTSERGYDLRLVQPRAGQRHAVFLVIPRESIESYYERNAVDPRVTHSLSLAVDAFGMVTLSAAVAYPRREESTIDAQNQALITLTAQSFVHVTDEATWYRVGVPYETRVFELTGFDESSGSVYTVAELVAAEDEADEIDYAAVLTAGLEKRLLSAKRQLYGKDDLTGALALGEVESLGLPYESYAMALTPDLVTNVFDTKITSDGILEEGGYVKQDTANWWVRSGTATFDAAQFYLPVATMDPFENPTTVEYDDHALFSVEVADLLGNVVAVDHDYRVLAPKLVTDPNGNRTAALFDELGMVTALALMGKSGGSDGDTLEAPTVAYAYDLERFATTGLPSVAHTTAREVHGSTDRFQETYVYADGAGREIMRKVKAEPGEAPERDEEGALVYDDGELVLSETETRWVGTGRTVLDNKGNPIKQYEPFFSSTHEYENEDDLVEWGVTPLMKYDALGRLIRADLPNGTFRTTVFDPWSQTVFDENDNVLPSLWYEAREGLSFGDPEKRAALNTAAQQNWDPPTTVAGTPTIMHLDVLGRVIETLADNGAEGVYTTKVNLDITGNPVVVTDARDLEAMKTRYDMLGRKLREESMDAGLRWALQDVLGAAIRGWDGRGHVTRRVYDALRRPTSLYVQKDSDPEWLAERTVYGELHDDPESLNLRGKPHLMYDGAGLVTNVGFDFKGNLLSATRQVAVDYTDDVDWSVLSGSTTLAEFLTDDDTLLEIETFTTSTAYDALNRPTSITTPDASEIVPGYNEAGLLETVDVHIRGSGTATPFVTDIDYNAKGQREAIEYGNGTGTLYTYDPLTFRLTRILTTRDSDSAALQDLTYTYDPIGNITEMVDGAQQTVFYDNDVVLPSAKYEYDALYRLIQAEGREHGGTGGDVQRDNNDIPIMSLPHANDSVALRNYAESYEYDAVGNIMKMIHDAGMTGTWTRGYAYAEDSNRLLATSLAGDDLEDTGDYSATYDHDLSGNMIAMPHLASVGWDFKDQMREADLGGGGTAYFTYGADGQRVRKVVETTGTLVKDRIYLGGWEIYRERDVSGPLLERETLHVMDDKQRIAMVETKTIDTGVGTFTPVPRTRYQLGNHLGSAMLEVDDTGAVISYEEYHPYGTTSYHSAAGASEVSARRYRYTGKECDEETGLYYHGARYYAPWLGRWTAADPAGIAADVNLYCYARSTPIVLMDPTGREPAPFLIPPQVVEAAESALARAAARWGSAQVLTGGATAGALDGAAVAAPAAAGTGLPAGAVATFAIAFLGSIGLATYINMRRSGSIARYGNVVGMPSGDAAFPLQKYFQDNPPEPIVEVGPLPRSLPERAPAGQQKDSEQRETVNLDTTTLVAASSLRDPQLALVLNAFLLDKNLVATESVVREFFAGPINNAGATEKVLAAALLERVTVIADDPSARVMNLQAPSNKKRKILGDIDKIAFGTGDKLGIRTVSSDAKFVEEAEKQGVNLSVVLHRSNPYATK